jgi:hypothetical protein
MPTLSRSSAAYAQPHYILQMIGVNRPLHSQSLASGSMSAMAMFRKVKK